MRPSERAASVVSECVGKPRLGRSFLATSSSPDSAEEIWARLTDEVRACLAEHADVFVVPIGFPLAESREHRHSHLLPGGVVRRLRVFVAGVLSFGLTGVRAWNASISF